MLSSQQTTCKNFFERQKKGSIILLSKIGGDTADKVPFSNNWNFNCNLFMA